MSDRPVATHARRIAPRNAKSNPKLTVVPPNASGKLAEAERQREIAYWRLYGFFAERQCGCSAVCELQTHGENLHEATIAFVKENPAGAAKLTAALHKTADDMLRACAAYDKSGEEKAAAYREAWMVFHDADRAVEKAGGKSLIGSGEPFPGVPKDLAINLTELEELARQTVEGNR